MIICGIDYSMTSPAITIHKGNVWDISNCKFFYLAHKDKLVKDTGQFLGIPYPKYTCDSHRYDNLSSWVVKMLTERDVDIAFIEGYAFGAVGRVFQIAENTGVMKYSLWKNNITPHIFAPTEIKKFATGKGNANKEKLYDAFFEETKLDIREILGITNKNDWNPLSDIVDSYYIAKLGFMKENENENHS